MGAMPGNHNRADGLEAPSVRSGRFTLYLRAYGTLAIAVALALAGFLLSPAIVSAVAGQLPAVDSAAVTGRAGLFVWVLRLLLIVVAGTIAWLALQEGRSVLDEAAMWERGNDGDIEVYQGFVEEVGVHPVVARSVVEAASRMNEEDRALDFHRANIPNFAAELGYRLGIDPKTREAMREFFEANQDKDTRRSFSTSMRFIMEGERIEQSHDTNAEVEPVSRFQPQDSEEKEFECAPMIFDAWDEPADEDASTDGDDLVLEGAAMRQREDSGPSEPVHENEPDREAHDEDLSEDTHPGVQVDSGFDPGEAESSSESEQVRAEESIWIDEDQTEDEDGRCRDDSFAIYEPEPVEPVEALDDDEIFAAVSEDPNIAALSQAILLTRRLPKFENIRYLYGIHGSDNPSLVVEFRTASITHKEQMGPMVKPLFNHAGVRRHCSPIWVCDLGDRPAREDDLSAVIWIPVGVVHLGDPSDRCAWKLIPVPSGGSQTFYALASDMPLAAARLEWVLGTVYDDMEILEDGNPKTFFIPSLQTTIDLMVTDARTHDDYDIYGDEAEPAGPDAPVLCNLSILADGGRRLFSSRLGIEEMSHPDWLAVFSLTATLCMRSEPVDSKELLGQWATPTSARGQQLISMLETIFGECFTGSPDGWVLSNVRFDLFWLDDLLKGGARESILRNYFIKDFEPDSLEWILNLGSMDPRTRTGDFIQMEQLLRGVLAQAVDILRDGADTELAGKLDAACKMIGKDS